MTSLSSLRVPPHNLDAERAVIGSTLFRPHEMPAMHAADFYHAHHQQMWRVLLDLVDRGITIDLLTLAEELRSHGKLDDIGLPYLADLTDCVSTTPEYYAGKVRDAAARRRLINAAQGIVTQAYESDETAVELAAALADAAVSIHRDETGEDIVSLYDSLKQLMPELDERIQGKEPGMSTGFRDLDKVIGGLRDKQLVILAARPGMGKSALALQMAEHVAKHYGAALFASLEMAHAEQSERLLSAHSGVSASAILHGKLTDDDQTKLQTAIVDLKTRPLFFADSEFDAAGIAALARSLNRKQPLRLLVVDYLQLCESSRIPAHQREQAVASFSRQFKRLSQELSIPVVALAQLNRKVEDRADKVPKLSDLRESGAIEQDANVVMFLYRPEVYDSEDSPGRAEVHVAKVRNGKPGMVPLVFQGDCVRFQSYAYPEYFPEA